jgi:hypothetical protein
MLQGNSSIGVKPLNEEVIWGIFVAENTERFLNFYPITFYSTHEKALEDIEGSPKDMNCHLVKFSFES